MSAPCASAGAAVLAALGAGERPGFGARVFRWRGENLLSRFRGGLHQRTLLRAPHTPPPPPPPPPITNVLSKFIYPAPQHLVTPTPVSYRLKCCFALDRETDDDSQPKNAGGAEASDAGGDLTTTRWRPRA